LIPQASAVLTEDRTVHYKRGRQLGSGVYVVEMSSTASALYIMAINVERSESLVLEITGSKAKDYLKRFEYDFEQMAQCLRVEDNGQRLVLLNPFFQSIPLR
jgi:hypothetical protein